MDTKVKITANVLCADVVMILDGEKFAYDTSCAALFKGNSQLQIQSPRWRRRRQRG